MNSSLEDFIEQTTGESHLRVQDDLGDGFYRLRAAEAQRRQAKQDIRSFEDIVLEMLRNARDADAKLVFIATGKLGQERYLTIIDDGGGVPCHLHETIFEPFVTSKLDTFRSDRWGVHGRGMALFSIAQNADSAVVLDSAPGIGSAFQVKATSFPERTDQSTNPRIVKDENGLLQLRGPRNISRVVVEFSLEERESMAIYLGSAVEIAATMYGLAASAVSLLESLSADAEIDAPLYQRLVFSQDPADFARRATAMGLELSERSARRVMDGDVQPLKTHLATALGPSFQHDASTAAANVGRRRPKKPVKLDAQQAASLQNAVMQAFAPIAESFYLTDDVKPIVKTDAQALRITVPLVPLE